MNKKIVVGVSVVLSCIGLWFSLRQQMFTGMDWTFFLNYINLPELGLINFRGINYVNLVFYSLMLTGILLYTFSKSRETRLLRFAFSILLLSKFIATCFCIPYLFGDLPFSWMSIVFIGLNAFFVWLFYQILEFLGRDKVLDFTDSHYETTTTRVYAEATNWQRVFHLVVDTMVFFILFFPILDWLIRAEFMQSGIRELEQTFGERLALGLILAFFRLLFFFLYEGIFATTPAKYLTETRVILDADGSKAPFKNIVTRTLSRFVPFEPLSFLGSANWHDRWSGTDVVAEKRTGVEGKLYFLIFPALILIAILFFMGMKSYESYRNKQYQNEQFLERVAHLEKQLQQITTDDVIRIRQDGASRTLFLKAEKVSADDILFSVIRFPEGYVNDENELSVYDYSSKRNKVVRVDDLYLEQKDSLDRLTISRKKLSEAHPKDFEESESSYGENRFRGSNLFGDERLFVVDRVDTYFRPRLKLSNSYSYSEDMITTQMYNMGWSAQITNIEGVDPEIRWSFQEGKTMPIDMPSARNKVAGTVVLKAEKSGIDQATCRITVRDTLGRITRYEITLDKNQRNEIIQEIR